MSWKGFVSKLIQPDAAGLKPRTTLNLFCLKGKGENVYKINTLKKLQKFISCFDYLEFCHADMFIILSEIEYENENLITVLMELFYSLASTLRENCIDYFTLIFFKLIQGNYSRKKETKIFFKSLMIDSLYKH